MFNIMRLFTLLTVLPAASVVFANPIGTASGELSPVSYLPVNIQGGRTSVAEGSPNGLYMYHNETYAAYFGENAPAAVTTSRRNLESRVSCDVSCNGQQGNTGDIEAAEDGLAGFFGPNLCWSKQISYIVNSVYAFGCDYGDGQCETSSDYLDEIGCVDDTCGDSQGGWNSVHSSKVTYGREFGSFGC